MLVGKPNSEGSLHLPWQSGDLWVDRSNVGGGKTELKASRGFRGEKNIETHAELTAKNITLLVKSHLFS